MAARVIHEALAEKRWLAQSPPSVQTIFNLLNRQDYRLVQRPRPRFKKNAEIDTIFENVRQVNALADDDQCELSQHGHNGDRPCSGDIPGVGARVRSPGRESVLDMTCA